MPPDSPTEAAGRTLLRVEAREHSTPAANQSPGSSESATGLENYHRSHSQASQPAIQIDLTGDTDDNLRKRSHDSRPLPSPSNKRPKRTNEDDNFKATASVPNVLQTKTPYITRYGEQKDSELEKKDQVIETERSAHASTQLKLQIVQAPSDDVKQKLEGRWASESTFTDFFERTRIIEREKLRILKDVIDPMKAELTRTVESLGSRTKELEKETDEKESARREVVSLRERLDEASQQVNLLKQSLERNQQLQNDVEKQLLDKKAMADATHIELGEAMKNYKAADRINERWAEKSVQWKEAKKKLNKDLSDARKGLKAANEDRNAFKAEATELGTRVEELQAESEKHLEECSANTGELLQHIRDLKGLGQGRNFKISDEELLEHWGNLKHKICQMVDRYARPLPGLNDQNLNPAWCKISSNSSALLRKPIFCEFTIEAYVWSWLNKTIFEKNSAAWAGDLGSRFSELSRATETESLRGSEDELMAEFQSWRSASSHFFSRLHQRAYNHESYLECITGLVNDLQQLLGFDTSTYDSARADATAILNDAREFDIMRRKLKAEINIISKVVNDDNNFTSYDGDFVSTYMRNRSPLLSTQESSQNPNVDLVISPAIIRIGNSDGVDYDKNYCLVKMDVLCNAPVSFGEQPDFQMDFVPPPAQPLTSGQPAALHNQRQQDKAKVSNTKEDITMERDFKTVSREASHLKITQTPQAASYVSAGDPRQHLNSNDASSSVRPTRSSTRQSAQKALVALTRGIEEPDELAGFPASDTDECLGLSASRSRRRQAQDDNDEPYVPDDED